MEVHLTCKLFDADAIYFIDPILNLKEITLVKLYRDTGLNLNKKLQNITNKKNRPKLLQLSIRFFAMLSKGKNAKAIVGIYEVPHGLLALLAGKMLGKPVVICVIGNPKYEIRNKGFRGWLTKKIYDCADIITVTGTNAKTYLVEHKELIEDKVFVLPNSIPIEEFGKLDVPKQYDLITLGRLSPEKGLFNLLTIVKNLTEVFPRITVGIAGKGPQFEELKEKISELGLEQNVYLLGYVDNIVEFLSSGKIFLTTSKTEGLPRTVIQSMFCGTPVIASDVGDMSDIVIEEKTGYLIHDSNDLETFSNKIRILLSDEKKLESFSSSSMQFAKENYSHASAAKVWLSVFKQLKLI